MTPRTRATALTAALLTVTAACSAPSESGAGEADSVVIGVPSEPATLSPLLGYGKDGNSKIFDGLLAHDADLTLKPALAKSLPEVSADGLTYTYTLREGVKFSDGKQLTAADVVFTYNTVLNPRTNNTSRVELDAVKGVKADGDKVVFSLKYPYAPFAARTTLPIVPEHLAGGQDPNTGSFNTNPVGTGPYVLADWRKGEKLTFKANPEYWGGAPRVAKVTMAIVPDDNVRATRLRAGDLDGAILPPNLAAAFARDGSRKRYDATTYDVRLVSLPSGNPVAGDTAIRRALDLAVDRDAMVAKILDGAGSPAYGPLPVGSPWFTKGIERRQDLAEAGRVLDRAGWKASGGGVRAKDGRRASFTLYYPAGDKVRQDHALAYASDAKKAGVEVEVQSATWEVIEPRMAQDAVLAGFGSTGDPDFGLYTMLYSTLAGDGFNNMGHYTNPTVDKALDAGRRTSEPAARKAAYDTLQRALVADPGYTFLTHIDHVYVLADRWDGLTTQVEPHEHGFASGPWWNLETWKPKQATQ
ncbi:ABC transporter substrate-binding protein [Streptomyces acidiscabies]|uniref:ABC transporter substrate-binding protein n=1 Tax=Streptomyces acidiscabies TaxID=42234 RepID=A0AAP6EDI1_9ACTN|nr:ABC transporter substrate-binding protein [Streptomyces acidiscabies]MBP5941339.1 ABC transporter substrate-binding protein [Streptomyces sp. LBUM 1476]MBZ3912692.1 ABC transporter substrate-binding protein [Streptomyces acidiscabies]MDX2958176.1 ABC transporter substrate-binding protein [Streptomyces acidiscabies]MDX3018543.1 ABC transporter substrate-binding protein [Streptomyces acidiscabies]MDX3791154.1 ABC transporter substrate-binding protein [Streptomyces acidiscabies]